MQFYLFNIRLVLQHPKWTKITRHTAWPVNTRALFSVCSLRDDNVITAKPAWKLKHTNSILEYFEYFCHISSKSMLTILRCTVSKLVRLFRDTVYCPYADHLVWRRYVAGWEVGQEMSEDIPVLPPDDRRADQSRVCRAVAEAVPTRRSDGVASQLWDAGDRCLRVRLPGARPQRTTDFLYRCRGLICWCGDGN